MSNEYEMPEGFAEPSYSGSKFENFALKKDSTLLLRILPAMKSLRRRNDYGQFWYTHFYLGRDPKNPAKTKSHPILCIQEKDWRKNGIIVKRCPLCEKREQKLALKTAIEAAGKTKNKTKPEIEKATAPVREWLQDHGHDGKWRLYAVDKSNSLGVLKLNNRCMKDQLRPKMKQLVSAGHTPAGVKGIFFQFTRVGNGFATPDEVQPFRVEQSDGSSRLDFHVLTPEMAKEALSVLPDFDEEQERIRYPEEVLEALAACNDDPDEVNRILGIKEDGEGEPAENAAEESGDAANDWTSDVAPVPAPAQAKAPAQPVEVAEEDEEAAAVAAAIAAAKAKVAASKAAKAAAAPATAPAKPVNPTPAPKTPTQRAAAPIHEVDPLTASPDELDAIFGG